ncbi:MAG: RNA-binding protein [Anaerolineales bacterium]|nr:RNA-binding protein [Anaerolineales bacterium]
MPAKLFVGNLAYATTEQELRQLFSQVGQITQVDLRRDERGQSRGFAFIVMRTPAQAQKAIAKFNGFSLADRKLRVNAAKPREGNDGQPGQRVKADQSGGYLSKLGGFFIPDQPGRSTPSQSRRNGNYQSTLGAYGTKAPPAPRRRGRGQRG